MNAEQPTRDGAPPNDGPLGGAPGPSAEIDRDHDDAAGGSAPSGLPDGASEAPPLGVDEADPEGEGEAARGAEDMPGIPTGGEPPAAS